MANYPAGTPALNLVSVVQNPSTVQNSDGSIATLGSDRQGTLLVRQAGGKRFAAASRGNLFSAAVGAVTLNIYSSTAATATLYNPASSNRLVEVHKVVLTQILAADIINGLVLGVSTVAPSATTAVTPNRMPIGGQSFTNLAVACSAATVAAPSLLTGLGISSLVTTGLATITSQVTDFDGCLVMAPGSLIVVGTSTTVEGGANFLVDFVWSEWLP